MSGERLLASYIVRVAIREGRRRIYVYDVASGVTDVFNEYAELPNHLASCEDVPSPGTPPTAVE